MSMGFGSCRRAVGSGSGCGVIGKLVAREANRPKEFGRVVEFGEGWGRRGMIRVRRRGWRRENEDEGMEGGGFGTELGGDFGSRDVVNSSPPLSPPSSPLPLLECFHEHSISSTTAASSDSMYSTIIFVFVKMMGDVSSSG